MSAIDELGIKWDHIHTNGFSANILAGIFELDDQRIKQADDIKQLRAAIEQRDLRIAGLDERLKAVNGMVERHIRLHIKEELVEPAPAPDLDALVEKYCKLYYEAHEMPVSDILRAFAAELGVK